jgi:hypothetical protein
VIYETTRAVAERMNRPGTSGSLQSLSGSLEATSAKVFFEDEEPLPDVPTQGLVQVARDPAGDEYEEAVTPGQWGRAWVGVKVTVHGVSNADGASNVHHQRACQEIVDAFLVELQAVTRSRKNLVRKVRGAFRKDPTGAHEHGARYELSFQLGRSVQRKTMPTATGTGVPANRVKVDGGFSSVSMQGGPTMSAQSPANTYTRSSGSFVTEGFAPGMTITVAGMAQPQNNGVKVVTAVTATTLTVAQALAAEAGPTSGVTITSGETSC